MAEQHTLSDPGEWIDRHGDYLFRYALMRVRHADIAEDLLQDTLLAALRSRTHFAGQSPERFWLLGILKHKLADYYRKASHEEPADDGHDDWRSSFDERGHWIAEEKGPKEWTTDPGTILEQKEFWTSLTQCLGELPPRQANAYSLREIDGLESAEVCRTLDISASNLWVMLYRVRMHLRRCLETKWQGR
ncbi:MAG TPA: sigma-70 family RNA polymerase sigma factor [Nitrospira sp.]|nr:sigma-70 family RNA polymerase sigma factor [Nitrospira sp.]